MKIKLSIIIALCTIGYAKEIKLDDVNVNATAPKSGISTAKSHLSGTTLKKETIENTPTPKRGLSDLLKGNPNVQFGNSQVTSKNLGEIDPQDISINGAKFYQNNFMIDGLNVNNDIDPSKRASSVTNIGGKVLPDLGSISQGINLDPDLIESITVHDSSVSARYGGFQGGVIDANTLNPRQGFHGKASISYTSDAWTKQHIDKHEEKEFSASYDSQLQPRFRKIKQNISFDGRVNDDLGLIFSYSQTRSKIPLKAFQTAFINTASGVDQEEVNIRRKNENFFLKGIYNASDRLVIEPMIIYAPSHAIYYSYINKDSRQTMKSGGIMFGLDAEYEFDSARLKQKLGYSMLESSREADKDYWIQYKPSPLRPWGKTSSDEGGFGDVNQKQNTFSYNVTLEVEPLEMPAGGAH